MYVHKLLTGQRESGTEIHSRVAPWASRSVPRASTIVLARDAQGRPSPPRSAWAAARDHAKTDENVVCIAGDAALTNGITYEALNNIKTTAERLIESSSMTTNGALPRTSGAISEYLNRIVRHPSYAAAHKRIDHFIGRLPRVGAELAQISHKVEEAAKALSSPPCSKNSVLRYIGPIDGHNAQLLIETLQWAKLQEIPVLIHILTKKGKGYEKALEDPQTFHGCGTFDIATGKSPARKEGVAPNYQDVFADALVRFCDVNSKLVGITAAMPSGTGLMKFQKAKRTAISTSASPKSALIFAAGMATMGYRPVCAIYSTFLQRAYDCIIHDVALQNLDVVFAMDRAGLSANDGPTHHGVFDIAYARCVPRAILMAPTDEDELVDMLWTALQHHGPIFIRYPRGTGNGFLRWARSG